MSEAVGSRKPIPRWFAALMFVVHLAWCWVAPAIHEKLGHSDEAAWLPLFLTPTALIGGALGIGFIVRATRLWALLFLAVFAIHLAVGLGYHPR